MKVLDLNFFHHRNVTLSEAIQRHSTSYRMLSEPFSSVEPFAMLVTDKADHECVNSIHFYAIRHHAVFFMRWWKIAQFVRRNQPEVVSVHGFIYPVKVIALRLLAGKRFRILVQHHGEMPGNNFIKKRLFAMADKCTDGYLFTSCGNKDAWVKNGNISENSQCFELLEASTFITPIEYTKARSQLNFSEELHLLWVGRLNPGKDPLTVLNGLELFLSEGGKAVLNMIYHEEELLSAVKEKINSSPLLNSAVRLIGKVPHHEMTLWYSASDVFISASHHEGSGYALIEALHCGCYPVITNIPTFSKITDNGNQGSLFKTGDTKEVADLLKNLPDKAFHNGRNSRIAFAHEELSFQKMARQFENACKKVIGSHLATKLYN